MVVDFPAVLGDILRVVSAILLLVLPGRAIVAALVPADSLEPSRRATVALASGVGVMAVGGLLLNYLPLGLTGPAWLIFGVLVVLLSTRLGLVRALLQRMWQPQEWRAASDWAEAWLAERRSADVSRLLHGVGASLVRRAERVPAVAAATIALAVVIALASFSVAQQGALEQDRAQAFTEFWMVPDDADGGVVRLGIISHELSSTEYSLRIESSQLSATIASIRIDPGRSWETSFTLARPPAPTSSDGPNESGAPPTLAASVRVRAILFLAGSTTPYRVVTLH